MSLGELLISLIKNNTNKFIFIIFLFVSSLISAQTHLSADPYTLLLDEKNQFQNFEIMQGNVFRPIFFPTDTLSLSFKITNESYYNNNAPNQENMDVRYFSKGISNFQSISIALNSPYLSLIVEPYLMYNKFSEASSISRDFEYSVLNDQPLKRSQIKAQGIRNFLAFFHYKGLGFGWHNGNRWWGPGIHNSLQMTNNTSPIPGQVIGTIQELRFGSFGIYGLYTFARMNNEKGPLATYFTALNGQLSWYGPVILSLGFSRNYLTGGVYTSGYRWTEQDARKIVFEGLLTSNLISEEYTIGGHDPWDQTLSGYFTLTLPERSIKLYAEFGFNDNRMFLADLISQPDHTLATVIGVRDYGVGVNKNWVYGFEWTNLMLTYTSRHRGTGGTPAWYSRQIYNYSTYNGRRWGSHAGSDSDDWYLYIGYLNDDFMIIPAFNYERHGIVTYRPAEVKFEFRLDLRYKYKNTWFGIYLENQYEAFLGFPDYYYEDDSGNPIDSADGKFANSRRTNTLIFSVSKKINL